MVGTNLYNPDGDIDPSSQLIREKIAYAVSEYILKNWDECVKIEERTFTDFTQGNKEFKSMFFKIKL